MNRRRRIYEGKAKILYEGPEPGTLVQHFKDDATAFNAKKKDVIEGKGVLNNRISEHIFNNLNAIGVPCGPIYTIDQVFADPQVQALGIAQSVTHPKLGETTLVGQPVELSRTPGKIEAPTPAHGAHTDDVLRDLGYDAQEIAGMRAAGAL